MNKKQGAAYAMHLHRVIDKIANGEVVWAAISVRFKDGGTIAIHSKGAPKRPRGVS